MYIDKNFIRGRNSSARRSYYYNKHLIRRKNNFFTEDEDCYADPCKVRLPTKHCHNLTNSYKENDICDS